MITHFSQTSGAEQVLSKPKDHLVIDQCILLMPMQGDEQEGKCIVCARTAILLVEKTIVCKDTIQGILSLRDRSVVRLGRVIVV